MRTLTVQDNVHAFQQVCSRDLELTLLEEHAGRYIPIVEDTADFLDLLYIRPLYPAKVGATWNYRTFTVDIASTLETRALGVRTGCSP